MLYARYIWIKICKQAGRRWHLGSCALIKSNRLRDSSQILSEVSITQFVTLFLEVEFILAGCILGYPAFVRGQGRFVGKPRAIPRFGERHPVAMHRGNFHNQLARLGNIAVSCVRALLVAGTQLPPFPHPFSPTLYSFIRRKITVCSSPFYFGDIDRLL